MQVLIVSATDMEAAPLVGYLKQHKDEFSQLNISFCTGGVGMLNTTYHLTDLFNHQRYDMAIQIGIAGSFDSHVPLAKTFCIDSEVLGDMGVEENEYRDIFDLDLADANQHPFSAGCLQNPHTKLMAASQLAKAKSVTVNKISTGPDVTVIRKKYDPLLESMEGAAFHYVCLMKNIPFLQFRSVSNYIGERDKSKWKIASAIEEVNKACVELLRKM
jgi:futalosine hydrolase